MKVIRGVEFLQTPMPKSVVTIGNFDGFHLGHRQLIQRTVQEAQFLKVQSVVFTFAPHPFEVLRPREPFYRLFDDSDQIEILTELGVDILVIQEFNEAFSKLSATSFFNDYLYHYLNPQMLVLGYDFHFGSQRQGDLRFLEKACAEKNISLVIIPAQKKGDIKISSSFVRELILKGQVALVSEILERPFYLKGSVVSGSQRGQTELVRTANLATKTKIFPKRGVYISQVQWKGQAYSSVTNVGLNPTFESESDPKNPVIKIETHLLGQSQNLYGEEIKVEFLKFIRDEEKFKDVHQLRVQILKDIEMANDYFSRSDFEKKN